MALGCWSLTICMYEYGDTVTCDYLWVFIMCLCLLILHNNIYYNYNNYYEQLCRSCDSTIPTTSVMSSVQFQLDVEWHLILVADKTTMLIYIRYILAQRQFACVTSAVGTGPSPMCQSNITRVKQTIFINIIHQKIIIIMYYDYIIAHLYGCESYNY